MADPYTKVVNGNGTSVAEYTLPPGVLQYVESVVATVDTSASGAVTPVLTVSEQSGVVIADKPQDDSIPGGGTGRATWALRLSGSSGGIRYGKHNSGTWLDVATTTVDGFTIDTGAGKAVTFDMPNNAIGGSLVIVNGTGDTVFDAGGDSAGNYGVDIRSGGTGSLQVDVGFELHNLNGNICRFLNVTLMDFGVQDFNVVATNSVNLQTAHATMGITNTEAIDLVLASGQPCTVRDHLFNPIFRVDENGDLHGKTGKTLTFDL